MFPNAAVALSENGEGGTEEHSDDVTGVANGTEESVPYRDSHALRKAPIKHLIRPQTEMSVRRKFLQTPSVLTASGQSTSPRGGGHDGRKF